MPRHRLQPHPISINSPQDDLFQISMQLEQNAINLFSNKINLYKLNKPPPFEGWNKHNQTHHHALNPKKGDHKLNAKGCFGRKCCLGTGKKSMSLSLRQPLNNNFIAMKRAHSSQLGTKRCTSELKASILKYNNEETTPSERPFARTEMHSQSQFFYKKSIKSVNYPILSFAYQLHKQQRQNGDIGKVRNLIKKPKSKI